MTMAAPPGPVFGSAARICWSTILATSPSEAACAVAATAIPRPPISAIVNGRMGNSIDTRSSLDVRGVCPEFPAFRADGRTRRWQAIDSAAFAADHEIFRHLLLPSPCTPDAFVEVDDITDLFARRLKIRYLGMTGE